MFLLYTADLLQLVKHHHLTPHAYADNTKIYGHCQPSNTGALAQRVVVCISEISAWMEANRLQLNLAKTEILWCASSPHQHLVPTASIRVGDVLVSPVTAVQDLGIYIDTDVTMRTHVTNIVRVWFLALHQIRSVRRPCPPARATNIDLCIGHYQAGPLQLGPCWYCWLPAKPAAVCAECRCSAHLFSSGVRTHNPTALGPSLVTCTGRTESSFGCVF